MSEIPMVSPQDLFIAQMRKDNHRDAANTASTMLEAVYAAYKLAEKETQEEAARRVAVLRGKVALQLLESAERVRRDRGRATDDVILLLMREVLRGWLGSEEESDIDAFAAGLLAGYPERWVRQGSALDNVYEEVAEEVIDRGHGAFYHDQEKLLRLFAQLPPIQSFSTDPHVDGKMIEVLVRGLPQFGNDWLRLMAQYAQAWYIGDWRAPSGAAYDMSLEHAKTMGQTAAAAKSLRSSLSMEGQVEVIGPHTLRLTTWGWYSETTTPSHYEHAFNHYRNRAAKWREENPNPPMTIEIVFIVKRSDESIWHEFKVTLE